MGLRYRKSLNLGGGFRITLSKSGIGYSWGTQGFRLTRTAQGKTRRTFFIPGTGISHVEEWGQAPGKTPPAPQPRPENSSHNTYDTRSIENEAACALVSEGMESVLSAAKRAMVLDMLATAGILLFLILGCFYHALFLAAAASLALKIYVRVKGTILLEYDISSEDLDFVSERMNPMIWMTKSDKVWRIVQTSKVVDTKYTSGAGSLIDRQPCTASTKMPFPFKANVQMPICKYGELELKSRSGLNTVLMYSRTRLMPVLEDFVSKL